METPSRRCRGFTRMTDNGSQGQAVGAYCERARRERVARQISERGVHSPRVLEAMQSVERHLFVPAEHAFRAYADEPLPIGEGQTISQPFIVAAMADALS